MQSSSDLHRTQEFLAVVTGLMRQKGEAASQSASVRHETHAPIVTSQAGTEGSRQSSLEAHVEPGVLAPGLPGLDAPVTAAPEAPGGVLASAGDAAAIAVPPALPLLASGSTSVENARSFPQPIQSPSARRTPAWVGRVTTGVPALVIDRAPSGMPEMMRVRF